jgi:hypothetical protein
VHRIYGAERPPETGTVLRNLKKSTIRKPDTDSIYIQFNQVNMFKSTCLGPTKIVFLFHLVTCQQLDYTATTVGERI